MATVETAALAYEAWLRNTRYLFTVNRPPADFDDLPLTQRRGWSDACDVAATTSSVGGLLLLQGLVTIAPGDEVDFGSVEEETPEAISFTLINISGVAVTIPEIVVPEAYTVTEDPAGELAAGAAVELEITFESDTADTYEGTVEIGDFEFDVTGIVTEPA